MLVFQIFSLFAIMHTPVRCQLRQFSCLCCQSFSCDFTRRSIFCYPQKTYSGTIVKWYICLQIGRLFIRIESVHGLVYNNIINGFEVLLSPGEYRLYVVRTVFSVLLRLALIGQSLLLQKNLKISVSKVAVI